MGDETPNTMNLDLNLGSFPSPDNEPSSDSLSVNLEDWIVGRANHSREADRRRARLHWRSVWRQVPLPTPQEETGNMALELLETGEGSVPADERIKKCDNNPIHFNEEEFSKKEDDHQKANRDEGSFFDCNICLDISKNPVVTCCGHLFCWTCLYRWLHIHSDAKECPVCKGEVTTKTITPIYGRSSSNSNSSRELEEDLSLKIPSRPQAHRVESWRQTIQRNAYPFPVEEMIRRLGNRFDLTRDLVQAHPQEMDGPDSPERNNFLLNRLLSSRGLRREQNLSVNPDEVVDLTESSSPSNSEIGDNSRRLSSLLLRRPHAHRAGTVWSVPSVFTSSERRLVQPLFRHHTIERNQDQQQQQPPLSTEDRDSVSSIAAVIQSESHTFDNAMEIDSAVSFSTSSSRRRYDGARVSTEIDSGDSRPPRRRRIN
ncbi:uncharacterized protein LOC124940436 [Impatiens glandulifera]|uniref:uncharacterized protein LOC124940436 n=1 Tax=Impatiens glandulifera TaxID=253017 RepID=UPI001FB13F72|nr:uncharacterized protein LOC124940436 [Impatiens glandulifera]